MDNLSNNLQDLKEIYNNLKFIKMHIKKFGITREFLHLVNTNNSLGSAIGLMLPYYESDGEIGEIEDNNLLNVSLVVEGLNDQINHIKRKIAEVTTSFKNKIERFKENLTYNFSDHKKQIELLKDRINKADLTTQVTFYDYGHFYGTVNDILKAFKTPIKSIDGTLKECPEDARLEAIIYLGYYFSSEQAVVKTFGKEKISEWGKIEVKPYKDNKMKKYTKSLQDLYWTKSNLQKTYNAVLSFPNDDDIYKKLLSIDDAYLKAVENYSWTKSEDWESDIKKKEEIIFNNLDSYYRTLITCYEIAGRNISKLFKEYISFLKQI